MKRVHVALKERSYPILIGNGLLADLGRQLKARGLGDRPVLVVTQKAVAVYHEKPVTDALTNAGFSVKFFLTPQARSSEASKSMPVYTRLIRAIAAAQAKNRPPILLALGGGVIGDLTGFAASVYRRGIPYVQVPTTLTAQVDSAIGGKTGIDLPEGKNLLGTIYQPALVLSDPSVLQSLPERHWNDGFSEVIKYGVIRDRGLFSLLEKFGPEVRHRPKLLEKVIQRCSRIKARIVEKDEFDRKDLRIVLNYGHTAGHAIEAASRFSRQYSHGEAVAIGMLIAADIAEKLGVLKERELTGRIEKMLMKFSLPVFYRNLSPDSVLKAMGYDKKSEKGVNCFVLPVGLGRTVVVRDVPEAAIREALERRRG